MLPTPPRPSRRSAGSSPPDDLSRARCQYHIAAILPDLVEIGRRLAAKLTFWGEIDRQWLLPHGPPADVAAAVRTVRRALWREGGVIAQCEFGIGARPENVAAVFETWDEPG